MKEKTMKKIDFVKTNATKTQYISSYVMFSSVSSKEQYNQVMSELMSF